MQKFTLVSLDSNLKPLRESVDLFELVDRSLVFNVDVSTFIESFDTLAENGYKIIVESEQPYLYESALHEASIKELLQKAKEKFGNYGNDEFADWYKQERAKREAAGAYKHPVAPSRAVAAPRTPGDVFNKNVTPGTAAPASYSRRLRQPEAPEAPTTSPEEVQAYVKKVNNMIGATSTVLKKLYAMDKDAYFKAMDRLTQLQQSLDEKYSKLAEVD